VMTHQTVLLLNPFKNRLVAIDLQMSWLIQRLWHLKIETQFCCEGNIDEYRYYEHDEQTWGPASSPSCRVGDGHLVFVNDYMHIPTRYAHIERVVYETENALSCVVTSAYHKSLPTFDGHERSVIRWLPTSTSKWVE
jgi:hypothetical protein